MASPWATRLSRYSAMASLTLRSVSSRVSPDFAVVSNEADVPALRPHFAEDIGPKYAFVTSREELERLHAAGCTRFGCDNPEEILKPPQTEEKPDVQPT